MPKPLTARRTPQQGRSRATVGAILEAAAEILSARDVENVNTRQIAERAGVGVGSLYEYFANKDALVRGLIARFAEQISTEIHMVFDARGDEPLKVMLPRLIRATIAVYDRNSPLHARLIRLVPALPGENPLDVIETPIRERLSLLLAASVDNPKVNVDRVALVAVHATRRLIDAACADDRLAIDLKTIEGELVAMVSG